jgi:NADPH-dependent curcumin reductase CurA
MVEEKEYMAMLRKGEILSRALFISVDPITRYRRTKYVVKEKE